VVQRCEVTQEPTADENSQKPNNQHRPVPFLSWWADLLRQPGLNLAFGSDVPEREVRTAASKQEAPPSGARFQMREALSVNEGKLGDFRRSAFRTLNVHSAPRSESVPEMRSGDLKDFLFIA
jgi:hypothetical protein